MDASSIPVGVQAQLAQWITEDGADPVPESAIRAAKWALLDWTGVAFAGAMEPLADILIRDALSSGETGDSVLVGRAERVSPAFAALINGATSHALDYDDINKRMRGHPSVTIIPALLALAEQRTCTGRSLLDALVVGTEVACVVGEMMGAEHYERGFHTTATVGTIAAAAGSAFLMGLNTDAACRALGLAATQAAGLQAMFGSMAKPLHAGKAAMNGLLAARWADAGMTAADSAIEGAQGFGATQSASFRPLSIRPDRAKPFGIERNVFKYHAACYYTHSAIDAANALRRDHGIAPERVERVTVRLSPAQLKVCDIAEPTTGLEVKFSICHVVAMALLSMDTGDIGTYTAETAVDPRVVALRQRIATEPQVFESRTAAAVTITLSDQSRVEMTLDSGVPADDADNQDERQSRKFHALVGALLGDERAAMVRDRTLSLEDIPDLRPFLQCLAAESPHA